MKSAVWLLSVRVPRTFLNVAFWYRIPQGKIIGIVDIYQPSLIEKALELAPKAKVYDDYREILEDKTVDAVLVATPLNSHCQIVLDAFDAGKHVFCEKSIGFTMEGIFAASIISTSVRRKYSLPASNVFLIRDTLRPWK